MATLSKKNLSKVLIAVLILVMVGAIVLVALSVDGAFADAATKSGYLKAGQYINVTFNAPANASAYEILIKGEDNNGNAIQIGKDTNYSKLSFKSTVQMYNAREGYWYNYTANNKKNVILSTYNVFRMRTELEQRETGQYINRTYTFKMKVKTAGKYTFAINLIKDKVSVQRQRKLTSTTALLRSKVWVNYFADKANEVAMIAHINREDIESFCWSLNTTQSKQTTNKTEATTRALLASVYKYAKDSADDALLKSIAKVIPGVTTVAGVLEIFNDFINMTNPKYPLFSHNTALNVATAINERYKVNGKTTKRWNDKKDGTYDWDHGICVIIRLQPNGRSYYAQVETWTDITTWNTKSKKWNNATMTAINGLAGQFFDFEAWGNQLMGI